MRNKLYIFPITGTMKVGKLITLQDADWRTTGTIRPVMGFQMNTHFTIKTSVEVLTPYCSMIIVVPTLFMPVYQVTAIPFLNVDDCDGIVLKLTIIPIENTWREFFGGGDTIEYVSSLHTEEPIVTDFGSFTQKYLKAGS